MSAADRNWGTFLQKLKENDTSLKDIADANEEILIGILDDFGFGHLQKGQILTRFKSETKTQSHQSSSSASAAAAPVAHAPKVTQEADASLKTWLQSLKLQFLEKDLVSFGILTLNDMKKLSDPQTSKLLGHSEMKLGHRKRFQRELGLLKHAETEADLKNLTVFFSDEEEAASDIPLPKNASSKRGEYVSPRVARPSAPSEEKGDTTFVPPVSRLAQNFATASLSAPAPQAPAPQAPAAAAPQAKEEIETSVIIPQPAIPFIWGRRAETVNGLQRQFGVKIDKDKQWEETHPSRKVTIRGSVEGVNQAKREIEGMIKEIKARATVAYFPSHLIGSFIGKGGNNIRKLESEFGLQIHAETENPHKSGAHYDLAKIEIIGNESDASKMKRLIAKLEMEELTDYFERKEDSLKLFYYPMLVEDAIAFLIGREGDRLRYLQHQSGTLLEVKDEQGKRWCVITGLPEGVDKAKKAVNLTLEDFEEERKTKRDPIPVFVSERTSSLKVSMDEAIYITFQDDEFSKIPNIRTSIYFSKAYAGEVVVEGKSNEVDQAMELFKKYLKDFETNEKGQRGVKYFTAPEDARGSVIGRSGASLRKITQASHVEAFFHDSQETGSFVALHGYPFQIQRALHLILLRVADSNRRYKENMGASGFNPITEEAEIARLEAMIEARKQARKAAAAAAAAPPAAPPAADASAEPAPAAEQAPAENGAHQQDASPAPEAASPPPAAE